MWVNYAPGRLFCLLCPLVFFGGEVRADPLKNYILESSLPGAPLSRELGSATDGRRSVELTSQRWRGAAWRHELTIQEAAAAKPQAPVFLHVGGDREANEPPTLPWKVGSAAGVHAALLSDVPNQPIFGRDESDLLAYSLDRFRSSGDADWPLLFPMVKSITAAMDELRERLPGRPERFVLAGSSKRAWAIWLAASVDERIAGIAPLSFELTSFADQISAAREAYGSDSPNLAAYTALGLTQNLDRGRMAELVSWLDPAVRFVATAAHKLTISGANDPYWVPDSHRHYWHSLPSPKALLVLPNRAHHLAGDPQAQALISAYVGRIAAGNALPQPVWRFERSSSGSATLHVRANEPFRMRIWRADSASRDFRAAEWVPGAWSAPEKLTQSVIDLRPANFSAALAELGFADPDGHAFSLSTGVEIFAPL